MSKLTTGDRLSCAAIGAVLGLFVGAMAAWLIGGSLYGESAGFAGVVGTAKALVLGAALVSGAVCLIGTALAVWWWLSRTAA